MWGVGRLGQVKSKAGLLGKQGFHHPQWCPHIQGHHKDPRLCTGQRWVPPGLFCPMALALGPSKHSKCCAASYCLVASSESLASPPSPPGPPAVIPERAPRTAGRCLAHLPRCEGTRLPLRVTPSQAGPWGPWMARVCKLLSLSRGGEGTGVSLWGSKQCSMGITVSVFQHLLSTTQGTRICLLRTAQGGDCPFPV